MKRSVLTLFILSLLVSHPSFLKAQDYKYLTMDYSSGKKSIELATVQKITFENERVVVATSNGNETFPLAEMQKMFFSTDATRIEEVYQKSQNEESIYDLSGRRILSPLKKGVYIINNKKVVKL